MTWLAAELPPEVPPACVALAAQQYAIPPAALVAVARQERGENGRAYVRSTGTYFGPFQVSDKWLGHFARWGLSAATLQHNACANAIAGAYVLAYYRVREPNWYRAVARYNVGSLNTPQRREAGFRYADTVMRHWNDIYQKWRPRDAIAPLYP